MTDASAIGFAKGFGLTFSTMFKKVYTQQYPFDFYPTQPRYHGRHVLNRHPDGLEKCVGCELCAWACPADAIYVEGGDNTPEERYSPGERYGKVYQINYLRCIFCALRASSRTGRCRSARRSRSGSWVRSHWQVRSAWCCPATRFTRRSR